VSASAHERMTNLQDSSDFYDDFVEHQEAIGVNDRHRAILSQMRRAGFAPTDRVLEIGCGVGTLTELVAHELAPTGSLLAVDLSPRSIEAAKHRLQEFPNVELLAADVVTTDLERTFDMVVMPDVIEHIPLEHHRALFGRIASWLDANGCIVINYPNPHYLAWCHEHRPDLVQIIDQPIHANELLQNAYPHDLYLDYLETYSIWIEEGDYVGVVLRPMSGTGTYTTVPDPPRSIFTRVVGRARRLIGNS
jgi:2-polyprenyl-3-methyl-5-hydroxy-6-metoxy-1,4-benzoquinol methylase